MKKTLLSIMTLAATMMMAAPAQGLAATSAVEMIDFDVQDLSLIHI